MTYTVIDFTLSNARRFYSSERDPLGVKGLKNLISLNPFISKSDLMDFTLSNATLGSERVKNEI